MTALFGREEVESLPGVEDEPAAVTPLDLLDGRRPNVSGDLPGMLQAAPMFRRSFRGYSRYQVDTYVQWAEDELAAAARENEDVLARYAQVCRDLDETQQLLSHSPGGAEFLRLSQRIGGMLAAAADQADVLVSDAQTHRAEAAAEADSMLADAAAEAHRTRVESTAQAERILAEAAGTREHADHLLAEAELTTQTARVEAEALLEEARATGRCILGEAERLRQEAAAEASAIRLQAQHEGVRLLTRAREERLRSDAEAAAVRERLDQQAAAWRAAVLAEVDQLEQKRAALEASISASARPPALSWRDRRRLAKAQRPALPAPREATIAAEPDSAAVRIGVWKRHGRRAVSRA